MDFSQNTSIAGLKTITFVAPSAVANAVRTNIAISAGE